MRGGNAGFQRLAEQGGRCELLWDHCDTRESLSNTSAAVVIVVLVVLIVVV